MAHRLIRSWLEHRFPDPPIVVGGPPRSGTTLLLSILGSHPRIHAIDYETTAFHPELKLEKLFAALFFENESRRLRAIPRTKARFAEKTPGNIRHAEEVDAYFGGRVKFINIFRDARDVITSRHPLNPDEYWVPLARWIVDVRKGLEAQGRANVCSIKYEELIADPEATIARVCAFLGETFDPNMLEYQKHTNVKRHLAWQDNARAIHADSLRKWERPEHAARIREFMDNAEAVDLSRRLGYLV
ncbi:MAG TPA: sulfotransferase [Casimicrobiaceae bacterium]|nr:sulfotransferase [Casimicrobiaceae bacterium]